jgi:hypothetical protein
VDTGGNTGGVGFIHRNLPGIDIYFVANTGNLPVDGTIKFRSKHTFIEARDPDGNKLLQTAEGVELPLRLAPYESRVFFLHDGKAAYPSQWSETHPRSAQTVNEDLADLSTGWQVRFGDAAAPQTLATLTSWTQLPDRQFYSGEATYSRSFTVDPKQLSSPASSLFLDFGAGDPIEDKRRPNAGGMLALLDPPVREAAIVFINGKRAGSLWHPPYRIGIAKLVHPGENRIEVHVYNTAINLLAGQPPRDYTALRARYGRRFDPQDMDHLLPIPSGLFGPIHLEEPRPK